MSEDEKSEDDKGLKAQVAWCINTIQEMAKLLKAYNIKCDITDPPTDPPGGS